MNLLGNIKEKVAPKVIPFAANKSPSHFPKMKMQTKLKVSKLKDFYFIIPKQTKQYG